MAGIDKIALGNRVAQRRAKMEISATTLASRVGMKQQGIASIEAGVVKRPKKLLEIAHELGTYQEWLLYGTGPEEVTPEPRDVTRVPLVSWVSAGKMAQATVAAPDDVPLLAFADLGRGDFFALKVSGDSMDRISPEGSIIVINRAERQLVGGKCYVFAINGETTYKMWHHDPQYLEPFSTNPANKPIFFKMSKISVVGRVRRTVLDL